MGGWNSSQPFWNVLGKWDVSSLIYSDRGIILQVTICTSYRQSLPTFHFFRLRVPIYRLLSHMMSAFSYGPFNPDVLNTSYKIYKIFDHAFITYSGSKFIFRASIWNKCHGHLRIIWVPKWPFFKNSWWKLHVSTSLSNWNRYQILDRSRIWPNAGWDTSYIVQVNYV